jgi:hypothetical protein
MMLDTTWIVSLIASVPLICAGVLAVRRAPGTVASFSFMIAMVMTIIAMMAGHGFEVLDRSQADLSTALTKIYVATMLLSLTLLSVVTLVYPFEREIRFNPPNTLGVGIALAVVFSIVGGLFAQTDFNTQVGTTLSRFTGVVVFLGFGAMITVVTTGTLSSRSRATDFDKHSSTYYLEGLWVVAASGMIYSVDMIAGHQHDPSLEKLPTFVLIGSVMFVSFAIALSLGRGRMSIGISPAPEEMASGAKSKYGLLQRRAYLVEEPRSDFSFTLFSDILRGRCIDCDDDESFTCESLGCTACTLQCPCKSCGKYKGRAQGLIVTRQFPDDVREKYFLHTTPILWLTTIAGNENMDPAKLSLLTDQILNFMEKSENGIVLVDGIEYLITSNDFQRVLKAVEMWTESTMASTTRLILSIDPKAYGEKELAVLERGREAMKSQVGMPS